MTVAIRSCKRAWRCEMPSRLEMADEKMPGISICRNVMHNSAGLPQRMPHTLQIARR